MIFLLTDLEVTLSPHHIFAESAWMVEYTDCFAAKG